MTFRMAAICSLICCMFFARGASAQPGDRDMNTEARVLHLLFPLDVEPKPYLLKLAMRFGDSDTQVVIVFIPFTRPVQVGDVRSSATRWQGWAMASFRC